MASCCTLSCQAVRARQNRIASCRTLMRNNTWQCKADSQSLQLSPPCVSHVTSFGGCTYAFCDAQYAASRNSGYSTDRWLCCYMTGNERVKACTPRRSRSQTTSCVFMLASMREDDFGVRRPCGTHCFSVRQEKLSLVSPPSGSS